MINSILHLFIKKCKRAVQVLTTDGPSDLIYLIIKEYERIIYNGTPLWKHITIIPLLTLYELHLLFDEQAIAYPLGRQRWQIVSLPWLQSGRQLPSLNPTSRYLHGSTTHNQMMEQIYSYPSFVCIERGDVVVDVGAYIGSFSMIAAPLAETVIAIEPNAANDDILHYNMSEFENVTVIAKAAWTESTQIEINQSYTPNENSVLSVDNRGRNNSFTVDADTVPTIVRECGYNKIDFLKIEAEGVEFEVLKGALDDGVDIKKIAVDASAERNDRDSISAVGELLESHDYEWKTKESEQWWGEYIVFGRVL